jgi:hypothetical protein
MTARSIIFGAALAGGFYAGQIRVGEEVFALIVSPKTTGEHKPIKWAKNLKLVDGARSFFDGLANTQAMAEHGSALADWAIGLRIADHADWYLPSRDELELCYRNLKPTAKENYCWRGDNPLSVPVGYAYSLEVPFQTAAEGFKADEPEAFDESWYWSSTQFAGSSDYAWVAGFSDGYQNRVRKGDAYRARAVRRLVIR